MLGILLTIFWLLTCTAGTSNDDNLRQALNEITYREGQLASPYYAISDNDRTEPDDRLMFLDSPPSYKDANSFEDVRYGNQKFRLGDETVIGEENNRENEIENYRERERYLKDRLLEKLLLDYLLNEEDKEIRDPRQLKRSFFRERGEPIVPDSSLQILYDEVDNDKDGPPSAPQLDERKWTEETRIEQESTPSLFRERIKNDYDRQRKPNGNGKFRNGGGFIELNERDSPWQNDRDYTEALNSAWEKYQDAYLDGGNAEHLTDELIEDFIAYLNQSKNKPTIEYSLSGASDGDFLDAVPFEQRLSTSGSRKEDSIDYLRKNPGVVDQLRPIAYSKRYWLGSEEKLPYNGFNVVGDNKAITVKKRSPSSVERRTNGDNDVAGNSVDNVDRRQNRINEIVDKRNSSSGKESILNETDKRGKNDFNTSSVRVGIRKSAKENTSFEKKSNRNNKKSDDRTDVGIKIAKKSVDWSNYFGVDKRQTSSKPDNRKVVNNPSKSTRNEMIDQYIQSYVRQSVLNSAFNRRLGGGGRVGFKRSVRLSTMDDDLKAAEDAIIDNVLKYTGAHEGIVDDPEEMETFKQTVLGQLGAAYNLEKLRRQMHQSDDGRPANKNGRDRNVQFYEKATASKGHRRDGIADDSDDKKMVTTTTKKMKTTVHPEKGTEFIAESKKMNTSVTNDGTGIVTTTGNDVGVHKGTPIPQLGQHHRSFKKKNSPSSTNEIGELDCPVLNDVIKKCYEIIRLAGDRSNAFLPFCTIHQICYICESHNVEYKELCDVNFISQAISFCGEAPLCQYTARRVMQTMYGLQKSFQVDTCDTCLVTSLQNLLLQ